MKNIAVILCGSGYKDGSEIREAVGVLWALSCYKAKVQCFALNQNQYETINCLNFTPMNETRNQLIESARIARGQVLSLQELKYSDYDGLIIPGGFGVAKNLCDFALKGKNATVNPLVSKILSDFYTKNKPIGAVCIAPVVLALTFKNSNFELTVGKEGDTSKIINDLGHKHIIKAANDAHFDIKNNIFSTPAYMHEDASLDEIFMGISKLVKGLLAL